MGPAVAGPSTGNEEIAMKMSEILVVAVAGLGAAGWSMAASADAAAGKAKFEAACAECHEAGDFEGEDAKALAETIKKIVGRQQKHKRGIKLSAAEITDVAGYMAAAASKPTHRCDCSGPLPQRGRAFLFPLTCGPRIRPVRESQSRARPVPAAAAGQPAVRAWARWVAPPRAPRAAARRRVAADAQRHPPAARGAAGAADCRGARPRRSTSPTPRSPA